MNIYLPLHVWDREFDSRLVIAYLTACLGNTSILGHEYNMSPLYELDQNSILFRAGAPIDNKVRGKWHRDTKQRGGLVITHDEEGVNNIPIKYKELVDGKKEIFLDLKAIRNNKYSVEAVKNVSQQIAWSNLHRAVQCHEIRDIKVRSIAVNRIESLSGVRFDLLGPFGERFQRRQTESIQNLYGDYILALDNFSVSNKGISGFYDRTNDLRQAGYTDKEIYEQADKTEINRQMEIKAREDFANFILEFAEENPYINIVFRPHPCHGQEYWEERFVSRQNISIVNKGQIHAWIYGATATVHSGCTTGIEAYAADKPTYDITELLSERCDEIKNSLVAISRQKTGNKSTVKKELRERWKSTMMTRDKLSHKIHREKNTFEPGKLKGENIDGAISIIQENSVIVSQMIQKNLGLSNSQDVIGVGGGLTHIVNTAERFKKMANKELNIFSTTKSLYRYPPNLGKSRYVTLNEIQLKLEDTRLAFEGYGVTLPRVKAVAIGVNVFAIKAVED